MLNSYNIYSGTVTTSKENGSPEGVINAASMTTAQIACLRYCLKPSRVTIPSADKIAMSVGNSNTTPKISTVPVNKDIYELRENVLGTSGVT